MRFELKGGGNFKPAAKLVNISAITEGKNVIKTVLFITYFAKLPNLR